MVTRIAPSVGRSPIPSEVEWPSPSQVLPGCSGSITSALVSQASGRPARCSFREDEPKGPGGAIVITGEELGTGDSADLVRYEPPLGRPDARNKPFEVGELRPAQQVLAYPTILAHLEHVGEGVPSSTAVGSEEPVGLERVGVAQREAGETG